MRKRILAFVSICVLIVFVQLGWMCRERERDRDEDKKLRKKSQVFLSVHLERLDWRGTGSIFIRDTCTADWCSSKQLCSLAVSLSQITNKRSTISHDDKWYVKYFGADPDSELRSWVVEFLTFIFTRVSMEARLERSSRSTDMIGTCQTRLAISYIKLIN